MVRRRVFVASAAVLAASPSIARAQCGERREWSGSGEPRGRAPANHDALSDEERAHVPVLTLPERVRAGRPFDLVVQVGIRPLDTEPDHHIEWIEVCLDQRRVFVADLSSNIAFPVVRLSLATAQSATLSARARCNRHGVWLTRREIEVL